MKRILTVFLLLIMTFIFIELAFVLLNGDYSSITKTIFLELDEVLNNLPVLFSGGSVDWNSFILFYGALALIVTVLLFITLKLSGKNKKVKIKKVKIKEVKIKEVNIEEVKVKEEEIKPKKNKDKKNKNKKITMRRILSIMLLLIITFIIVELGFLLLSGNYSLVTKAILLTMNDTFTNLPTLFSQGSVDWNSFILCYGSVTIIISVLLIVTLIPSRKSKENEDVDLFEEFVNRQKDLTDENASVDNTITNDEDITENNDVSEEKVKALTLADLIKVTSYKTHVESNNLKSEELIEPIVEEPQETKLPVEEIKLEQINEDENIIIEINEDENKIVGINEYESKNININDILPKVDLVDTKPKKV